MFVMKVRRSFCDESKKKLEEAVAHLDSSEVPEATKASIKSCIEGALLISSSYRAKYEDLDSRTTVSSSSSMINEVTTLPPVNPPAPIIRSRSENWSFIDRRLSSLQEKEVVPWDAIYLDSRSDGYFSTYKNSASLRTAYSRWKKNSSK